MQGFFYFCVFTALALNVLSCSKNEAEPIPSSVETRTPESLEAQRAANAILIKFMKLDKNNERYYLDISCEDALKLGVPAEFYDRAIQDIETTNRYIQQYRWYEQWYKRYESFNKNIAKINLHVTDPSEWSSE